MSYPASFYLGGGLLLQPSAFASLQWQRQSMRLYRERHFESVLKAMLLDTIDNTGCLNKRSLCTNFSAVLMSTDAWWLSIGLYHRAESARAAVIQEMWLPLAHSEPQSQLGPADEEPS